MFLLHRRLVRVPRRYFSCSWPSMIDNGGDKVVVPWYIKEAQKATEEPDSSAAAVNLPEIPSNSPVSLSKIVEFAVRDMGLKDVTVIDRRNEDYHNTSALGPSIIILGTGASTRHLGSAGGLLLTWLKHEFGVCAGREGILTTNYIKLHSRRQLRRQQRQRNASEDAKPLQKVGPWIAIDTKLDNVYVHLMTAERRKEVNLEDLGEPDSGVEMIDSEFFDIQDEYSDPNPNNVTGGSSVGIRHYSTSAAPSSREELALENLVSEKADELTEESDEVKDFVAHFPKLATRDDWKRRLQFFAIAAIQSPVFPLRRVVSEAKVQQSSGFVLDDEDVETVITAVCYHGQSHFAKLPRTDESNALWHELCDYKAQLLIDVYDFALRPTGRSLVGNSRLLVLLYRTFAGISVNSTTPSAALINPAPSDEGLDVFFNGSRLHPLRYLLESTQEIRDIRTVAMILTSLVNNKLYDAFWKVADLATVSCSNRDISEQIAELAASLIVKTGDHEQIRFVIQTYLPNSILTRNVRLTKTLVQAIEAGLQEVDSDEQDAFKSVRAILADYHRSIPQPN